ncbi:hypothetical protein HUJ04_002928 [Dendroctonus ponderosae]
MDRDLDLLYSVNRDQSDLEFDLNIPRRYIRDMDNPLEKFTEADFRRRFRFSKEIVQNVLLPLVGHQREQITNRGLPVPLIIGLLLTLQFYGSGSLRIICGELKGFHQSTVSRVITKVTRSIYEQSRNYIKFPENLNTVQTQFQTIRNFPNVIGCIGCAQIPIMSPGGPNAELFRNGKRSFSLNVQIVAGPDLEIYDIVATNPGSYRNDHVFNRSAVKTRFEKKQLPGYLLGDSGYPSLTYLLTPFRDPCTNEEKRYNEAHAQIRNIVDRTFGVLRHRFSCLRRLLRHKHETICCIIVACAVLHNISIAHREVVEPDGEDGVEDLAAAASDATTDSQSGQLVRATILRNHFSQL